SAPGLDQLDRLPAVLTGRGDHHVSALGRAGQRDPAPDAAAGAGHDDPAVPKRVAAHGSMTTPPSTAIVAPVTKWAASLASSATTGATSRRASGARPRGPAGAPPAGDAPGTRT